MIETFIRHLKEKERFSFARFGDGEINAVFGLTGMNCDGHEYFPEMGRELFKILKGETDYYLGEAAIAQRVWGEQLDQFLIGTDHNWINADTLHLASIDDTIWPFFEALSERDVVLVGPPHVHEQKLFKVRQNVTIPEKNCWLDGERINNEISVDADGHTVICWCASMAATVWIDAWSKYASNLDMGSLIDPYVGRITRSHHKKIKL